MATLRTGPVAVRDDGRRHQDQRRPVLRHRRRRSPLDPGRPVQRARPQSGNTGLGMPDVPPRSSRTAWHLARSSTPSRSLRRATSSSSSRAGARRRTSASPTLSSCINSGADFTHGSPGQSRRHPTPPMAATWAGSRLTMLTSQSTSRPSSQTPVGRVSNSRRQHRRLLHLQGPGASRRESPTPPSRPSSKNVVFSRWLTELQGNALVWQDSAALDALSRRERAPT